MVVIDDVVHLRELQPQQKEMKKATQQKVVWRHRSGTAYNRDDTSWEAADKSPNEEKRQV